MNHRALQWLLNFKDPDALTTRWLEKAAASHYEIEHRSSKRIGHADCMSRLPAELAALNLATITDISMDEENPSPPTGQEELAHQSTNITMPKDSRREISSEEKQSEVNHGYNAGDRKTGSKMTMIEQQGNLLDFEHPIAQCISADFMLGAGIASQIKEKFPSSRPRQVSRNQALHVHSLGQNKYVYHLITKPRLFHKATFQSLRKALVAMRDQLFSFAVRKLGLPHLACGLENLEWTEVKRIVHEGLGDLNLELTVFSLETSPVSTKLDENPHPTDLKEAQIQDVDLKQVKN